MEADEQQQRTSTRWKGRRKTLVLVVEEEKRMDCITTYLLFNINIKDMFTHDDEWTVLRPLPRPMAQMDTLRRLALEYLNFAVVASNTIVGVSNRKRTVLLDLECDATADVLSPGPELPEEIIGGTEGDWELPIDGRGVFVPELGLCPRLRCLCAFDLPTATAPPVVRYVWPETFSEELNAMGVRAGNPWQLGLPGTMGIQHDHRRVPTRFALLLIAVQLQRDDKEEFCLVSRKLRCYDLPANAKKCLPAAYLATVRLLVTVGAEGGEIPVVPTKILLPPQPFFLPPPSQEKTRKSWGLKEKKNHQEKSRSKIVRAAARLVVVTDAAAVAGDTSRRREPAAAAKNPDLLPLLLAATACTVGEEARRRWLAPGSPGNSPPDDRRRI
uniref:Uncharacterized protein n=1 Tax=Oryza barthii TaxID=65489 RepID=A0A0D3FCF1_9ORYZ